MRGFRHLEIRPKWRPGRGLGARSTRSALSPIGEAMLQCLRVDMGLWRRAGSGATKTTARITVSPFEATRESQVLQRRRRHPGLATRRGDGWRWLQRRGRAPSWSLPKEGRLGLKHHEKEPARGEERHDNHGDTTAGLSRLGSSGLENVSREPLWRCDELGGYQALMQASDEAQLATGHAIEMLRNRKRASSSFPVDEGGEPRGG